MIEGIVSYVYETVVLQGDHSNTFSHCQNMVDGPYSQEANINEIMLIKQFAKWSHCLECVHINVPISAATHTSITLLQHLNYG